MVGKDEHGRPEEDKVTHLDGWRKLKEEQGGGESALPDLLQHMRQVRDSIPVNNMLREELRKELARRKALAQTTAGEEKNYSGQAPEIVPARSRRGGRWLLPGVAAVFLLLLMLTAVWHSSGPKVLEPGETRLLNRFRAEDAALVPATNPEGTVTVLSRSGALLLLDGDGGQFGLVNPPAGEKLMYPAWTPDGSSLALVRRQGDGEQQIIVMEIPSDYQKEKLGGIIRESLGKAKVVLSNRAGADYADLAWSPDSKTLAFSVKEPGGEYLVQFLERGETVSMGPGRHPAWAPDGSMLAVERMQIPRPGNSEDPGQNQVITSLWLVDRKSGKASLLGEGGLPAWGMNGYLAYVDLKIRERVLSYLPDGSPQFSVQQLAETVRTVYLGKDHREVASGVKAGESPLAGSQMLITAEDPPGPAELEWMRRLELSGVREPRMLLLGRAGTSFESIGFGLEGKWIVACRRDGDTVVMSRVSVNQRPVKGGK